MESQDRSKNALRMHIQIYILVLTHDSIFLFINRFLR